MEALLTGARIQEIRLETISNSLANINTPGFKENKIFSLDQVNMEGPNDGASSTGSYMLNSATLKLPVGTFIDFTQGPMVLTGNPLDLALEGNGFFSVMTPDGKQYTRNGTFTINEENVLVTKEGYPVLGSGGEISIDTDNYSSNDISIDETGRIFQGESEVGTFQIESFEDNGVLKKVGETLFAKISDSNAVDADEEFFIRQGYLEQSNVEAIRAMTEMIEVLRGYEAYQKALKTVDQIDSKSINDVGAIS